MRSSQQVDPRKLVEMLEGMEALLVDLLADHPTPPSERRARLSGELPLSFGGRRIAQTILDNAQSLQERRAQSEAQD